MARIYLDERDQEQSSSPSTGGRVYLDERDAQPTEQPAQQGFSLKSAFSNFISKVQGLGKSLAESTGINATIQDLNQETLDIYKQSELTSQLRTVSVLQEKASKAKDEDTRNRFLEMARKASEQADSISKEVGGELKNKTDKQLRGQALQTGIDVGTALPLGVAAKGAQAAVEVAPKTLPAIFKAIAKSAGKGAAEAGAIGAPYGVAQSFAEGEEDPKEVIKNAIETAKNFAIFGGATNAVVGTLTAALAKFKKSPKVEIKEEPSPKKEEIVNQEPVATPERRKVSMTDVATNRDEIVPLKKPEIDVERPAVQDIKAPATQEPKSLTKEEFVARAQARKAESTAPKLEVPSKKKASVEAKVEKVKEEPLVTKEDVPRETSVKPEPKDPVKKAEAYGFKSFAKDLGDEDAAREHARMFWAKKNKGNEYYHVSDKKIEGSFDKKKSRYDHRTRGGGISQINGLYLGKDKKALNEFYGMSIRDAEMADVQVSKFKFEPKWLDLTNKADEEKLVAEVMKKKKIKNRRSKELGDALEEEIKKRGYDGVKYFDPYATGEEYVLVREPKKSPAETLKSSSKKEAQTSLKVPSKTKKVPKESSKPKLEIPSQKKADAEEYRYHTTSEKAIEKIRQQGMKPSSGQYGKGVYFAPTEAQTGGYGSAEGAMIRIKKGKLPKDYGEFPEQGWTENIVPPENLEYRLKGEKEWKPMVPQKPKLEIPSQKKVEVKAPAPEKKASIPVKVEAKPIEGTEKTKTRGLSRGVEQKAIEKKLTEGFGSLPEYKGVSMKDQAEKAYKIVDDNPEYAKQIAMGTARPPEGVLPESVFIAVENEAIANGDAALLQALATQSTRVGEATTMGQRIRVLAERNPDSPVANIKDVASSREKMFEEQTGKDLKKEKKSVKGEVKERMKKEVPTKEDWGKFLDDIQC